MGEKSASIRHDGGLRFVATTGSGFELAMDNASGNSGPRPSELIVVAVGGCTAMDVVSILAKKRQVVTSYGLRVVGVQQEQQPQAFERIDVVHEVAGPDVEVEAVRRAIELSATKYCTVSATLASGQVEIHHRYEVSADPDGEPVTGEVVVTGPHRPYPVEA